METQGWNRGMCSSFNTHKETVKVGTGLINGRWGFDARLSNIHSDGYRDRASADLKSYFVQGGYYGRSVVSEAVDNFEKLKKMAPQKK